VVGPVVGGARKRRALTEAQMGKRAMAVSQTGARRAGHRCRTSCKWQIVTGPQSLSRYRQCFVMEALRNSRGRVRHVYVQVLTKTKTRRKVVHSNKPTIHNPIATTTHIQPLVHHVSSNNFSPFCGAEKMLTFKQSPSQYPNSRPSQKK
jgi:hypothetical protein